MRVITYYVQLLLNNLVTETRITRQTNAYCRIIIRRPSYVHRITSRWLLSNYKADTSGIIALCTSLREQNGIIK